MEGRFNFSALSLTRYGVAFAAVAVAAVARALLDPLLKEAAEFFLFTLAVVLGAWRGGLWPGLFATALSAVAISVFFAPPYHRPLISDDKDIFGVALFTLSGGFISWLSERRLREEEARRKGRERILQILSGITDSYYSLDRGWRFTEVNARALEHLGKARDELLGRVIWDVFPQAVGCELQRRLSEVVASSVPANFEIASLLAPGKWFDLHAYPSEEGLSVYFRDVTERRRHEEERERLLAAERAARGEAEAASRTKDEFLALVSHELRNPLNSILGWLRILRDNPGDDRLLARALAVIGNSARAQSLLVEDLLDTARITSGKLQLRVGPVDLASVTQSAADVLRPAAEAKSIRLYAAFEAAPGELTGDADRLQQVVWNLLSNAIKFTPEGGRVEVSLRCEDARARITVRDSGCGIRPEMLPHVFERFRQGDGSSPDRRHGGLGLGLSLVRHIVELHGGDVQAESAGEGHGATFTVTLPLQAGRAAASGNKFVSHSG